MAINTYGGGGGGGTALPGFHSDTAEFHYRMDGDLTDSGTGNVYGTLSAGTLDEAPYFDVSCQRTNTTQLAGSVSGHPMKTGAAVTVAAWVWLGSNPSANMAVCGVRGAGSSGNPNAYNFCWELGITSAGYLRFFWQYDNKVLGGLSGVIGAAVPLKQWVHVMGTRNAAGTACEVFINGVSVDSTTGETAWNGGGSMNTLAIGNDQSSDKLDGYIASVYGNLGETTDGEAFYNAAKASL